MYTKGLIEKFKDRYEYYNTDGKLHREDGPAMEFINVINPGENDRYFLNGKEVTKEDIEKLKF